VRDGAGDENFPPDPQPKENKCGAFTDERDFIDKTKNDIAVVFLILEKFLQVF
jgi:hypothetical protein